MELALKFAAIQAFEDLHNIGLADLISTQDTLLYKQRVSDFWSLAAVHKKPHFIVHPKTTEHVVKIVKTLVAIPDLKFAVRSGGHSVWGASNTDGGVLVDLGLHMTKLLSVDKEKGIASVQPGAHWRDIYKAIEPYGVHVAGGRTGGVGVAGFLTGGGISWYIPRIGFGCNQIVNMEVVLADGRVMNVNKDENSDLYRALKGASGGNFCIVTRFDLRTLPNDPLWGGLLLSEVDDKNTADHISAMKNFIDGSQQTPNSSYFVLWNYGFPNLPKKLFIMTYLANTKGIQDPPELKKLLDIPTIMTDVKHKSPYDYAVELEQPDGHDNHWQNTAFVNDERIMAKAVELHEVVVEKMKAASKTGDFMTYCLFQSFPAFYSELDEASGGNVLGLKQHLKGRNGVLALLSINTNEPELRDYGRQLSEEYLKEVDDFSKSLDSYIGWQYVNYAQDSQNPLAGLLNPEEIKKTALKYDPGEVFQKRTPGFKISKV